MVRFLLPKSDDTLTMRCTATLSRTGLGVRSAYRSGDTHEQPWTRYAKAIQEKQYEVLDSIRFNNGSDNDAKQIASRSALQRFYRPI